MEHINISIVLHASGNAGAGVTFSSTVTPDNGSVPCQTKEREWPVQWCTDAITRAILETINSLTPADLYSPCKRPPILGVQSGKIPDSAFFASSFVQGREPYTARLNGRYAWRPAYMDADQYLYIDLG